MSDLAHLKEWLNLPDETKLNIFTESGRNMGLPAVAIEKDWWVVHTISLIFTMDCARSLVFKGLCVATHKPFNELIKKLKALQTKINTVNWYRNMSIKRGFRLATLVRFLKRIFTLKK